MMHKHIFYDPHPTTKSEFDRRYKIYRDEWNDTFLKVIGEESDNQWDRIVDRRVSGWFYVGILNTILAIIIGVLVGKFLL
jgi:hypothetical protein